MNLRITAAATAALLSLALVPAAQAKNVLVGNVFVCNTASQNWQGDEGNLVVDPALAVHYYEDLIPKWNTNAGLINAAQKSRALEICDYGTATGDASGGAVGGGST